MMRIVSVGTHDFDGGASRAAYRLHQGLLAAGEDSWMLVSDKSSSDAHVVGPATKVERGINLLWPYLDSLPLKAFPRQEGSTWSLSWLPNRMAAKVSALHSDIVHLHWVGFGFIPITALSRFAKPLVWTFHDMWAFTGGCHYGGDCTGYTRSCGACPQLGATCKFDLSYWIFRKKMKEWQHVDITVVTPSRWLAECARASALFADSRIEVIPNGLDTSVYQRTDKGLARKLLNLPNEDVLILFGAINGEKEPRKGLDILRQALLHVDPTRGVKTRFMVLGSGQPLERDDLPYETTYLGRLRDDASLALAYAAADVFVAPSRQENLSNAVMEAMACGTPCVSFAVGGFEDMIAHRKTGYLARPYDPLDLAAGINWVLGDENRHASLCGEARRKVVADFSLDAVVRRHVSLYQSLLP